MSSRAEPSTTTTQWHHGRMGLHPGRHRYPIRSPQPVRRPLLHPLVPTESADQKGTQLVAVSMLGVVCRLGELVVVEGMVGVSRNCALDDKSGTHVLVQLQPDRASRPTIRTADRPSTHQTRGVDRIRVPTSGASTARCRTRQSLAEGVAYPCRSYCPDRSAALRGMAIGAQWSAGYTGNTLATSSCRRRTPMGSGSCR